MAGFPRDSARSERTQLTSERDDGSREGSGASLVPFRPADPRRATVARKVEVEEFKSQNDKVEGKTKVSNEIERHERHRTVWHAARNRDFRLRAP
jgi:hypothetical protein